MVDLHRPIVIPTRTLSTMETEPIWIGSTYCTSSRNNTLVLTQPNAVFDIGVTAGADKFLQTITPRSAIVSSVSTADNFLSLCGQSAKLSEIDLGCVDLIDLFRVGSKDQSLH